MGMQPILDHTRDLSGVETHRLTSIYAPPEFVKAASHEQLYGPEDASLPAHVFADQRNRLFPCHTKAATWMSALFFLDKYPHLHPDTLQAVGKRIEKVAEFFGIKAELDELKTKMAADDGDDLARLPDTQFALVWADEAGNHERHYPLRNSQEVKMAADWFAKYRDEFLFPDRSQIAGKILARADELGTSTNHDAMLMKTAGLGNCAAATMAEMLTKRAGLVSRSHPEYATEMRKMAAVVQQHAEQSREIGHRLKMAEVIDQFDRQTHLDRLYSDGLERPEEILFQVTEKMARDFVADHVEMTSGSIYEKSALADLTVDQVRDWMGEEFADEVSTAGGLALDTDKLADVAHTLPLGDAEMFDRMTRSFGIPTFARTKAAHAKGMSIQEMAALAEQYGTRQGHTTDPVDYVV